jgi:hypothetical protein
MRKRGRTPKAKRKGQYRKKVVSKQKRRHKRAISQFPSKYRVL